MESLELKKVIVKIAYPEILRNKDNKRRRIGNWEKIARKILEARKRVLKEPSRKKFQGKNFFIVSKFFIF